MSVLAWFAGRRSAPEPVQITVEVVEELLENLCALPENGFQRGKTISEQNVLEIQQFLSWLDLKAGRKGRDRWSLRPRIYAILRVLGRVHLMDGFIKLDLNDIYLPWKERTLPGNLLDAVSDSAARQAFLDIQYYYLTQFDVKSIEYGRQHQNLSVSGDAYFKQIRRLGQGGFGGVDEVYSNLSLTCYARKRVSRGRDNDNNRRAQEALVRELESLRILSKQRYHRHLVKIIGSYTDPEYISYLMKPVAEGNLEQFLAVRMDSGMRTLLRHFYGCLAGAVHHLHRNRIRHRDLTARNILIYRNEVYLSDFGAAYNWAHLSAGNTRHLNPPVSRDYMSPEISKMEERGVASDMWSLGVIYLEMTTRLLGRQIGDLKQHVRRRAADSKTQPFYFANIPAVMEWLNRLSASEENMHDNEPISWVRDLMHPRPEDRPSAWELMKDILESPSFTIFCCFKCHGDYQDEAFAYDSAAPRDNRAVDASTTITEVSRLFSPKIADPHLRVMGTDKMQSIDTWISSSFEADAGLGGVAGYDYAPRPPLFGLTSVEEEPEEGNAQKEPEEMQRPIVDSYEHSSHNYFAPWAANRIDEEPWSQTDLNVPVNGINWDDREVPEPVEFTPPPTEEAEYHNLRDSNLGFMEYDDVSSRPYDEVSDRSDRSSEILLADTDQLKEAQDTYLGLGPIYPNTEKTVKAGAGSEEGLAQALFEEESDRSDDAISDISGEGQQQDGLVEAIAQQAATPISSAPLLDAVDISHLTKASVPNVHEVIAPRHAAKSDALHELIVEDIAESTLIGTDAGTSDKKQDAGPNASAADLAGVELPDTVVSSKPASSRREDAISSHSTPPPDPPLPIVSWPIKETKKTKEAKFSVPSKKKNTEKKAKEEKEEKKEEDKDTEKNKKTGSKDKDQAGRSKQPEGSRQPGGIPRIQVEAAEDVPQGISQLSKANLAELNKGRAPRSPKKREALLGVDPAKIMHDFCDMASSAPSSQLTSRTKRSLDFLAYAAAPSGKIGRVLISACENGSSSTVKYILNDKQLSRMSRAKQRVALIRAVQGASSRHNRCVQALIEAGADADQASATTGKTPLHLAIENGDFHGYTKLVWLLADPESGRADVNKADANGNYPLTQLFAGSDSAPLEQHRLGALAILLKAGVDTNVVVAGSRNTPLHLAVRRQDHRAVAMLLHMGAAVNARSAAGTSPLQMAANQFRGEMSPNHAEVLDLLLRYGASVDERAGAHGRAALHWAVISGTARAVEMLLLHNASPDLEDSAGLDAMSLAVSHAGKLTSNKFLSEEDRIGDHVDIMLRLNQAAGCAFPTKQNRCPVDMAIRHGNVPLLKKLMSYHLDPEAPFLDGTVREFAKKHGNPEILKVLGSPKDKKGGG